MTTESPTIPDSARDAAAYWFARVHSGTFTVGERDRFQQWRRVSPDNEREYRALDEIWQATKLLPEADLRELMEAPSSSFARPNHARRRLMIGASVACTAALVGGVVMHEQILESFQQPQHVARYATGLGEQRSEVLPDGSVIQMNVSTELVVNYYAKRRSIDLVTGEATFEVTPNPEQPFFVDAGSTLVRVTGTVFNVRREDDYVDVAVQSGSVEVSAGRWWNRERAMLSADMMARTQTDHSLAVKTGDVRAVTAWRQGKVVFQDQPLEDMVKEMNRYLSRPIYLTDSKLKRLRMAGVFGIEDGEAFLQALQRSLSIVVNRRPDGAAELSLQR